MTTTTTTATKLLCPECRRENEPERVYCHDCGTRLDRSAVLVKKEPIQDTHKRVKQMFDPTRARLRAWSVAVTKLIVAAGVVALLVDMCLPPDVPPPAKNAILVSSLRFDLESMVTKHQPPQRQIDENTANAFIASVVRSRRAALDHPLLRFKRAVVAFHEDRCSVTAERSWMDYWSIYTTCGLATELKEGRLTAKIESARIGRLPIHPKIAQFMGILFNDLRSAFEQDLKFVSKMRGFEFHDKNLTLTAPAP
jgi:hypothetical protein